MITELGNRKDHLSTSYKTAFPTQKGIEYLEYTTRVTKKFMETIYEKYRSSFKDKMVEKVI